MSGTVTPIVYCLRMLGVSRIDGRSREGPLGGIRIASCCRVAVVMQRRVGGVAWRARMHSARGTAGGEERNAMRLGSIDGRR